MLLKLYTLFILFQFNNIYAQNGLDSIKIIQLEKDPVKELEKDIIEILNISDFGDAHLGVLVYSLDNNDFLFSLNEKQNFVPASTLKLLSTSAALDYLGSDFHYKTEIFLDGEIQSNGEFIGDLVVKSNGDPSISNLFSNKIDDIFETWIKDLEKLGIVSIRGNIIADDSYFEDDNYPIGWAYDDLKYYYAPQVNAINFYENKIDLELSAGNEVGYLANYKLTPKTSYVQIINNVNTSKSADDNQIEFYRDIGTNIIELYGNIRYDNPKKSLEISIENPSLYFISYFKEKLIESNIRFKGRVFDADDLSYEIKYPKEKKLSSHSSPTLNEIIKVINKESNNLLAEILLKTLAKEKKGIGNFSNGIESIKEYANMAGIPSSNLQITDASGLSRNDLFSPKHTIYLLNHIYRQSYYEDFKNSLAAPNQKGTLKRRMGKSKAEFNLFAKTGSMNNISNICGYVKTEDGEMLAFAIFMNNFTVPSASAINIQDMICMRLSGFSRNINKENKNK